MGRRTVSARQRAERLVHLYELRGRIDGEIGILESAIANEAQAISIARGDARAGRRKGPAICGTDSGYYRHLRKLKQPACPACLVAHAVVTRERASRAAAV